MARSSRSCRILLSAIFFTALTAHALMATTPSPCTSTPRVIVYDFKTSQVTRDKCGSAPNEPITLNDSIKVRVEHINPFRRAVQIQIEQTTFSELYEVPSLISQNLQPSSKPTEAEKSKTTEAQKSVPKAGAGQKSNAFTSLIPAAVKAFQTNAEVLAQFDEYPSLARVALLLPEDPTTARQRLNEVTRSIFSPTAAAAPSDMEIARLRTNKAADVERNFQAIEDLYKKAQAQKESIPPEIDQLVANERARHEIITSTKAQRDKDFLIAVNDYGITLDPNFGTVFTDPPVAVTGDEVEITVKAPLTPEAVAIASGSAGVSSPSTPTQTKADDTKPMLIIPVKGNFRPSFSSGIFFTGLVSPTYSKDALGKAKEGSSDRFSAALGALVHTPAYYVNADFSLALSLGVALKDSTALYVLGPSAIVGRRQRTVFSIGVAGGQVTRLNGIKPGDPVTGDQPPTSKVFRYSFFFGLSYNFGPSNTSSGASSSSSK